MRRRLAGRTGVQITAAVTDFGQPSSGFITWRVGVILDLEVHPVTEVPVRVREAGLELENGTRLQLGTTLNMNKAITRPEQVEASGYLDSIRTDVAKAGSPVRGFYALLVPDRVHRQKLPRGWEGFPEKLPPLTRERGS